MACFTLWPGEELAGVDHNLPFCIERDLRAIHRARRRAFEVDALAVVATAVARAFEFVFTGLPIRRAAEMSAARIDNEEPVGSSRHPDAVLLLPFCVDADSVIGDGPNTKYAGRFENRARQEKPHEHQKESSQCSGDSGPDDPSSHFVYGRI